VLSRTVSKLSLIIGQIFARDRGRFILTPSLGVIPENIGINFTSPETRMIVLPDAEDRTIVSSFLSTKRRNVTDRRTDRHKCFRYCSSWHCKQCRRTVKKTKKNNRIRALISTVTQNSFQKTIQCYHYCKGYLQFRRLIADQSEL